MHHKYEYMNVELEASVLAVRVSSIPNIYAN